MGMGYIVSHSRQNATSVEHNVGSHHGDKLCGTLHTDHILSATLFK